MQVEGRGERLVIDVEEHDPGLLHVAYPTRERQYTTSLALDSKTAAVTRIHKLTLERDDSPVSMHQIDLSYKHDAD